jgi:hypothetical protein
MAMEEMDHSDAADALDHVVDDTEPPIEIHIEPTESLDLNRIRRTTKLHRSVMRARSWALVGAVVCLIGGFDVLSQAFHRRRIDSSVWPFAQALLALAMIAAGVLFLRKADQIHKEMKQMPPVARGFSVIPLPPAEHTEAPEPSDPPD